MARMESTVTIARPVEEIFGFFLALDENAPKTDPSAGYQGISLLVAERDMPGFERGSKIVVIEQAPVGVFHDGERDHLGLCRLRTVGVVDGAASRVEQQPGQCAQRGE